MVFKCKMCGGNLNIEQEQRICECEYCGTTQTLPRFSDDRKPILIDRANHFIRNNEFDKAMGIYAQIISEDPTDPEGYWMTVLCRYGVEYVEDPTTKKRIPTVHRTQFTPITSDEDFLAAMRLADNEQRLVFEEQASIIEGIRQGVIEISQKEEPFDIFICYKENNENGRTHDSVYAQDIYNALTAEGYKVFFARVTLEDKLGSAYEPYIFAALNSAKVMLVIGTCPEHFRAVWVKNEWSRYLSLINKGENKTLIPIFKGMDPYDLPEEFAYIQSLDLSKIGFIQDLLRGIGKIIPKKLEVKQEPTIVPILKRAEVFLADGDFKKADEYCEKALDIDAECAEAYYIKLMASLKITEKRMLGELDDPFADNSNYIRAYRYGNDELKAELDAYINAITDRIKEREYNEAKRKERIAEEIRARKEEIAKYAAKLREERQQQLANEERTKKEREAQEKLLREQEIESIWREYPDVKRFLTREIEKSDNVIEFTQKLGKMAGLGGVICWIVAVIAFFVIPAMTDISGVQAVLPFGVAAIVCVFVAVTAKNDKIDRIKEQVKTYQDYLDDPIKYRYEFRTIQKRIDYMKK